MADYYTVKQLRSALAENLACEPGDVSLIPADLDPEAELGERHLTTLRDHGQHGAPCVVEIRVTATGKVLGYGLRRESGISLHASPQAALDWLGGEVRPWRGVPIPGLTLRDALELRSSVRRTGAWRSTADEGERDKILAPYTALVDAAARLTLAVAEPDTDSWLLAKSVVGEATDVIARE